MHAEDTDTSEATETAASGDADGESSQSSRSTRGADNLGSWLAIGLGVCVTTVNIALAIRIWKLIFVRATSGSLLYTLLIASFLLGLFLIGFGIALRRSPADHGGSQRPRYAAVATVLVTSAGAFVMTISAANAVEPDKPAPVTPKACADLYQQAIPIHQASKNFRFLPNEPDQRRCDINRLLRTIGK